MRLFAAARNWTSIHERSWRLAGPLIFCWLCLAQPTLAAEGVATHTTGDWPVPGLGNVRARVAVSEKADAVWAHIPWRRRDARPENKDVIVVDAATGKRVNNAATVRVNRECGDLLFQPPTAPGEYYFYYLPFKTAGSWYFPTTIYLSPTNTAEADWTNRCAPIIQRLREGQPPAVAAARLIDLQAINEFHRSDPMEVTATSQETSEFMGKYGSRPYLLFPEDRRFPIRMTEELPLRWIQSGPERPFIGEAARGEFYAFQVGLYACRDSVEAVQIKFSDLKGSGGATIPAAALRCINVAGTNWLGKPMYKIVTVPKGKVQAFWCGVALPEQTPAQTYRGKVSFQPKNAPAAAIDLAITVSEAALADAGDGEIWRQSRLRWLDSTIGLDDEVFAPYTPVAAQGDTVSVLGRKTRFHATGLFESIKSTFSRNVDSTNGPERELLAGPMGFVVETADGPAAWRGGSPRILGQSTGAVSWQSDSTAGRLRLECRAKMDGDGYVNFMLTLESGEAAELKDIRLEIPLQRERAVYMMGLGREGGYRPESWDWKWDVAYANGQLWLGDVDGGLSCKLKHVEDRWDLANMKETGCYKDWSNDGKGGCKVATEGERVVMRAYTGPRRVAAGEKLHFNFGLMITPVRTLDKNHWQWRYYHREGSSPVADIAKTGASVINLHQGDKLNPYINYPFLTTDKLSAYAKEAHERNMRVKLYYTIRELSDYTGEFWALRSLGHEVFTGGAGFHVADQFEPKRTEQALPNNGDSWLCEHVVTDYAPAWHTPLGNGRTDAAIATSGLSRWHNYYLEGLSWLIRKVGIDGLYLDGIGYDREIMKRVRKVLQREGRNCLIDFHSGNNHPREYGLNSCANQYLELFPYIDSLWFGEGFDYNAAPDYWLVEMAGIPYGLFGEMLQGGGNPWRGMVFGMSNRLGWGGDPRPLWKVWDEFGIQEAKMQGYWDPLCPVKTGQKDILATAYVKHGKTLVSVASWATNAVKIRLEVDNAALGLDPAKMGVYAPPITGFQPEAVFKPGQEIPVRPGRGWLLQLDETERKLPEPADLMAGKKMLLEERFAGQELVTPWIVSLSQRPGTKLSVVDGHLQISAVANAAVFAERPLPTGTTLVRCLVDPQTDQGASWGPGITLVWADGHALRINLRVEGRFGVDDGSRQLLEGNHDPAKPCQLVIVLDSREVILQASEEGVLQEIARFPRSEFPGDPAAIRLGKMSPGSKNEDFSPQGPAGACSFRQLQIMGN